MRVVQFTPPGSACSIVFGAGMGELTEMKPGTVKGLHLVVADIDTAREALVQRGLEVGEITDMQGVKYAGFSDPDGNLWLLQEFPPELRQPGQSFFQQEEKESSKDEFAGAHNPALKPLEVLVGEWEMELAHASFLPRPSDTVKGHVSFEWAQGGAFLLMRMGNNPPDATWLISRDESIPDYTVLYYDARSVSRVYQMSFSNGVWKLWRNAPGFSQRFTGTCSSDGNTIRAAWEKSSDGLRWEHDFDVTYTKVT